MEEHNKIKCTTCGAEVTALSPAHNCRAAARTGGLPHARLTVYIPNIGKFTKQIDPAYKKRAGSRPAKRRRVQWVELPDPKTD